MIVRIAKGGTSFKGATEYLTHDPKAQTTERVAWTHTHNLANEYVPAAVNEMYTTAESAEWLKEQASVRAGGRPIEKPVRHVILSWAEADEPSREHMVNTGKDYLEYMGWADHQAIMVAHQDKPYAHLHLIVNAVHPETGKALDDGYAYARSQKWALQYELDQNRVHCTERLKNEQDRARSMPRNIWMELKDSERQFVQAERNLSVEENELEKSPGISQNSKNRPFAAEWEMFKEIQRAEREQFFAEGKIKFQEIRNSTYQEMREEFRGRWADYFEIKKSLDSSDPQLGTIKDQIVADQKAYLEPRRDARYAELAAQRKELKEDLYAQQRATKAEFRDRLDSGADVLEFIRHESQRVEQRSEVNDGFRQAGHEVTAPVLTQGAEFFGKIIDGRLEPVENERWAADAAHGQAHERDSADVGVHKARVTVAAAVDALFFDLTNLGAARPEPVSAEERADQFREAAENSLKQQQYREREVEDDRWREKQNERVRE